MTAQILTRQNSSLLAILLSRKKNTCLASLRVKDHRMAHYFSRTRARLIRVSRLPAGSYPHPMKVLLQDDPVPIPVRSQALPPGVPPLSSLLFLECHRIAPPKPSSLPPPPNEKSNLAIKPSISCSASALPATGHQTSKLSLSS